MAKQKSSIDGAIRKLSLIRGDGSNVGIVLKYLGRKDEATGTQITKATGLRQPEASRHLMTMYRAGLVTKRVDGVKVWYKLDREKISIVHSMAAAIVNL